MSDPGEGQAGPGAEPDRWVCAHGRMFPDECQAPECIAEDRRQSARALRASEAALAERTKERDALEEAGQSVVEANRRSETRWQRTVEAARAEARTAIEAGETLIATLTRERDEATVRAKYLDEEGARLTLEWLSKLAQLNHETTAARAEATKAGRSVCADCDRDGCPCMCHDAAIRAPRQPEPTTDKGGRMRNEVRIVIRTGAIELEAVATVEAATPEAAAKLVRETLHDDYLTTVETIDVAQEG